MEERNPTIISHWSLVISHWKTKNKGVPEPVEGQKRRLGGGTKPNSNKVFVGLRACASPNLRVIWNRWVTVFLLSSPHRTI